MEPVIMVEKLIMAGNLYYQIDIDGKGFIQRGGQYPGNIVLLSPYEIMLIAFCKNHIKPTVGSFDDDIPF